MWLLLLLAQAAVVILSVESRPVDITFARDPVLCELCQDTVRVLQDILEFNGTLQDGIKIALPVCVDVLKQRDPRVLGENVCQGLLESYGPAFQYVMTHTLVKPRDICTVLRICTPEKTESLSPKLFSFNARDISTNERQRIKKKGSEKYPSIPLTKPWPNVGSTTSANTLKIVQFNDVHLDPYYKEGTPTDCGYFICCRSWHAGNGTAGYYGDYNCDLPRRTFDFLLETIKSIDPDFLLFAGDNPPHDVWNETVHTQLSATQYVVSRAASILPNKTIYPSLGNHETYPESEYFGSLPLYQEITEKIAQYWQEWVEFPQEALQTIATGGYYTVMVRNGLQLISINSDFWYGPNFYSFLNDDNRYYSQQTKWLEETLASAKKNGNKVMLLAHIPSGDDDNLPSYGQLMLNITKRYKDIIVGIFTGHTHGDQFELIQDIDGIHGVTLVSPSVTTYGHLNPSFRVYYMDKSTYQLIDYEQYHLDLKKANVLVKTGIPVTFELAYQATDEYSMPNISPSAWGSLVKRFEEYDELIQKYYYNLYGRSKPYGVCDMDCQRNVLCQVKNSNSLEYFLCKISS